MKQIQIYLNIATLLDAGIDIHSAISQSVTGTKDNFKKPFGEISKSIRKGSSLAKAIREYPKIFPPFDSNLIETGEQTGMLPESFRMLAEWYTIKERMLKQMLNKLWYPLFLLHAAPVIMNIPGLFEGMSLNRYVMEIVQSWMLFYIPFSIIIFIHHKSQRSETLKEITDRILSHVPVLGNALFNMGLARFSFIFWAFYKTGSPLDTTIKSAVKNCGNTIVKAMVAHGVQTARKGQPVSAGFSEKLPHDFRSTWAVGEKSGSLERTTLGLARQKSESAEDGLKWFAMLFARTMEGCIFIYCAYWIISEFKAL